MAFGIGAAGYGGAPSPPRPLYSGAGPGQPPVQAPPTYGSYTLDAAGKVVPIAGSQGVGGMQQALAAASGAQQAPAPVVNSWTINPPGTRQYDPAAMYNQGPTGGLPPLNTGGVNPYLTDPLMAGYRGQQNPLYMNQQQQNDFYGDPELFGGGY